MELELKKISENDIEQVSQLYYSAFPEDERAPWKALIEKHNKGKGCLLYTSIDVFSSIVESTVVTFSSF